MMSQFLIEQKLPFCKGCGHHHITRNTVKALDSLNLQSLDVILVTDIGCHGIVDCCFATHTVHGLHGRSVAMAAGMAMALPPHQKVIVFIGDGGATIGLQHILEAARWNIAITVVVHNNMLYGMTGGQPSGLTPCDFRTSITPDGSRLPHHDLCLLARNAGAAFTARVLGSGDFSSILARAIQSEGFALVEVLELCTSYGTKFNPSVTLKQLAKESGYETGTWKSAERKAFRLSSRSSQSLLNMQTIESTPKVSIVHPYHIILGGSAGEGIQSAAELLAQAALVAGLQATKKGSYPVTVQTGFSTAELIFSPTPILCHAFEQADAVIITSTEGLQHNMERINSMKDGKLWIDASLTVPATSAEIKKVDFRQTPGNRNAIFYALYQFIKDTNIIPLQAFLQMLENSPLHKSIPSEMFQKIV